MLSKESMYLLLILAFINGALGLIEDSDQHEHEYVFTIPRLGRNHQPHLMISSHSGDPIIATLSIPGYLLPINRTITRNNGADIELEGDIKMNPREGKQNKTIIVRSSGDVSVYTIDNKFGGGDAFQCIPSAHLGTKYSVTSYKPIVGQTSFVCVSALISPTIVTISNAKEIIHSVTLQRYESYRYDGDDDEDLSGLIVHGTKAISVITGSVSNIVNASAPDGIMAQLTPSDSWGTEYYLFSFQSLNSGFVFRVTSYNISTTLKMCDGSIEKIQPGEFYEGDVSGDTIVSFEADKPVMVAQYMKGYHANTPGRGDPSMLIIPPVSSYTNHVRFSVFRYTFTHTYYINIVTQCDNIGGLLYDEAISVASWDKRTTDDQSVCCVRSSVSTGYHSVTHANPGATFFVSVYAIGDKTTYAYAAMGLSAQDSAQDLTPMVTTDAPYHSNPPTESETPEFVIINKRLLILFASFGGVLLIAWTAIVCFCLKRCKTSAPVINDNSEAASPNTTSKDDDNEGYETPRDMTGYQDLELSTMTSSNYEQLS